MKTTSLYKCFKLAAILPLAIAASSGIGLCFTHDSNGYKSEWSTDDGFVLTVFLMLLASAFITLLSLTIFLNQFKVVKGKAWCSFLAWFLLPVIASLLFVYHEAKNFMGYNTINGAYEGSRLLDGWILLVALIHVICLGIGWFRFREAAGLEI